MVVEEVVVLANEKVVRLVVSEQAHLVGVEPKLEEEGRTMEEEALMMEVEEELEELEEVGQKAFACLVEREASSLSEVEGLS